MARIVKDIFGTVDYVVFSIILSISAAIGIWYAFADRKKSNTQEFLLGGRSLSVFPVAMSVLASSMSAITLLGTPAEIYRYGTQYMIINIAFCLMIPSTAYLYLPVFYNLGITSAYEYLELRFHKIVRTIGSVVFILHMGTVLGCGVVGWFFRGRLKAEWFLQCRIPWLFPSGELMYLPIVLYAPALALSEVTGFGIWTSVLSTGFICTFYTSIGGMKAVVWTDFFQSLMMYASILVVLIKGTIDLGGSEVVWQRSLEGHRIELFRFDFDPTIRHTFWSLVIGGYITWLGNYAANQSMIQRYLTIGTLRGAQSCLWISLPALILLICITSLSGLVIYAFYAACDPIGTKMIDSPDQLFSRFVMETLGSLPGIPGLFVSGIFSGALSTVSTGVSSLAAVSMEDFIKPYLARNISELWATRLTKSLAFTFGILSIALVYIAQQLGGVLQAALTIHGIIGGPMLGLFTLGMFFSCANTWGACTGLFSGFVIVFWFGIGAFAIPPYHPKAPVSYHNCSELYYNATLIDIFNFTTPPTIITTNDDIFPPYKLSYLWLSATGFVVVLIVGLLVSLVSGATNDRTIDQKLISPIIPWLSQFIPGGRCKKLILHRNRKGTSLSTLKTASIISLNYSEFYPSKKVWTSNSEIS